MLKQLAVSVGIMQLRLLNGKNLKFCLFVLCRF